MRSSRITQRLPGVVVCVGLLSLASCMLLQLQPAIGFQADPVSGAAPRLVDFAPIVEGGVATYEWDFGDGATSSEMAPAHMYRTQGT